LREKKSVCDECCHLKIRKKVIQEKKKEEQKKNNKGENIWLLDIF